MKRLFYMMLICISVIMLWGCTENGTEDEPTPPISYLEFSEETDISPEFEAKGGTSFVEFTSSHDWTASANQSWITLSRKSGTPQKTYFNITVSKNSSTSKRTGTVTITADNKSYKINVSQQGAEKAVFEFSSDTDTSPEFEAKGGTSKVSFTTSHDWTANANQSWISLSRKSGTTSNSNFTITVSENTSTSQRTGTVTITSNSKSYKVSISQKGKEENKDIPYNTIYYKSTDGKIVTPYAADVFGANIASNIYANGEGIITFDGDVTNVGTAAFKGCSTLTEIILPNSVIDIETQAFFSCSNLKLFYGKFASEDNRCLVVKGELKCLSPQVEGNYTLPSSITSLGRASLSGFRQRVSITIPNSVTSLSDVCCTSTYNVEKFYGKFATANNLALVKDNILYGVAVYGQTSYVISDGVTTIMENVFQSCTKLETITLPSSVSLIGKMVFNSCTSLTTLYCKAVTPPQIESNSDIFRDIENVPTIYVPRSSVDTYKSTTGWSKYASYIKGYDFPDAPVESTFEFSSDTDTTPEFEAKGGTSKVSFTTSHDWTASANQSWISLSRKSGTPSTSNFTITVSENTSTSQRTGVVTITSNSKSYKVNVTQNGRSDIIVFKDANVKYICVANYDTNNDEEISYSEAESVTTIGTYIFRESQIVSFPEFKYFKNVKTIQDGAFFGCKTLTNIEIPNSVTSIGVSAFYNCTNLSSVNIPTGVTTIESTTFYQCSKLTQLSIPSSVTKIDYGAFQYSGLTSIILPNGLTSIGEKAFYGTSITSIEIPSNVYWIKNYAFCSCGKLSNITIQNGVSYLGEGAFAGCQSLTNITIPNSVTSIGDYVFQDCTSLSNIVIGEGVASIGAKAFYGCNGTLSMYGKFIESDFYYDDFRNPSYWLYGSNFTEIIIGGAANKIGNNILTNYGSLTSVAIGNSITSIGESAFSSCKNLASVTIGNSVTVIGGNAFGYCASLTSITIPDNVIEIGDGSFVDCKALANIKMSKNTITIGRAAFRNCAISKISISDNVKSIGEDAFLFCFNLRRVDISNLSSWCKIDFANKYANPLHTKDLYVYDPSGAKLFINNVEEYNITIPLDVKEIKDYAFCGCTSIGWVEIHKDITRIGSYAFRDCTKLQTVKCYPTAPPATGEKVFYHDYIYHTNLLEIWVPTASYNQYVDEWGSGKVVDSSDIVGKLTY